MICHITGFVFYPDGTPVADETLVFRRKYPGIVPEVSGGAMIPRRVLTQTDAEGRIDVNLFTGQYEVCAGGFHGLVYVPDAPEADFASILIESSIPATPPQWYLAALKARDEAIAAALRAEAAADSVFALAFTSYEEAEAANIPTPAMILHVNGLAYKRDPAGNALSTADGATWSPAGVITSGHWNSPLDGVNDDAPAIMSAFAWAEQTGADRVTVSGMPSITKILLPGEMDITFEGPQTAIGTLAEFAVEVRPGNFERRSKVHGLNLLGNNLNDGGVLLTGAQYWTFYDPVIGGFNKPGAWAMVVSGDADNRNSSSNVIVNPNFANCNNLLKFGKNPDIVGSQNTGASFNTIIGGYLGPFGDNTDNLQYGVLIEVGEGNKALNTRVSTNKHHTVGWEVMDARTQLIGCAGDGPCFTAFVYPLGGGTGTVDSITLLGVPLLTTPVAWAGSRMATSEAIVAQIEADGNQHPATEFLSVAHAEQVMFFRVDADGNKVRLNTPETPQIAVTSTGLTVGNSSINMGLLQGAPYTNFPDVPVNKWGYRTGHGGVMDVWGFRYRANPEGSGRGSGSLIEPEGNGPQHIVWFDDENTQRATNVIQAGSTVHGGNMLTTDAVMTSLDNQIQAAAVGGNATIAHALRRFRIQNFGPQVFAEILLRFTPTFTLNSQIYIEMPQLPGVYNVSAPLDVNGMRYLIPAMVSGLTVAEPVFLVVFGGQVSVNGHPFARLMTSAGAILTTSVMTSGQQVEVSAWGNWPVNRFA